jgi:hypothetical protein
MFRPRYAPCRAQAGYVGESRGARRGGGIPELWALLPPGSRAALLRIIDGASIWIPLMSHPRSGQVARRRPNSGLARTEARNVGSLKQHDMSRQYKLDVTALRESCGGKDCGVVQVQRVAIWLNSRSWPLSGFRSALNSFVCNSPLQRRSLTLCLTHLS